MRLYSILLTCVALALCISCTKKQSSASDTIRGVLSSNVKGLDPINASDSYAHSAVAQVYEGLFHYHYLKRPLVLQPLLAESLPEISKDGKVYTIKIKKGIRFQDNKCFEGGKGREVTAEDFIYSWRRLADPATKARGWWAFDKRIVGLNEWRKSVLAGKANYDTPIEGLKAIDSHTLQVKLVEPFYQFSHLLAHPFTFVVPKEAVETYQQEFINTPVGTGPFILESWIRGSKLTYVKNPNYHEVYYPKEGMPGDKEKGLLANAGQRLPFASRIEIREISEYQTLWLNFIKGDIDFTYLGKEFFGQAFSGGKLTEDMKKKGIRAHIEARPDIVYTAFNMENPLFKNKKLRHAIAMAYDNKTVFKTFYNERGVIAQGPIPPGLDGYDENFQSPLQYDIEKAKQLLKEAGYPGGKGLPEFGYELSSTNTASRHLGEYFKQQMALIGIKVKIIPNSWPQFDKKIKTKKADIFSQAWTADYPDGENFLQLYYSKNSSPGSNASNFRDPEFDKMYLQAARMPASPQRTELYKKMARYIAEEAPNFYRLHRADFLPYHGWLNNFKYNRIILDNYKYMRADTKKREELKKKM